MAKFFDKIWRIISDLDTVMGLSGTLPKIMSIAAAAWAWFLSLSIVGKILAVVVVFFGVQKIYELANAAVPTWRGRRFGGPLSLIVLAGIVVFAANVRDTGPPPYDLTTHECQAIGSRLATIESKFQIYIFPVPANESAFALADTVASCLDSHKWPRSLVRNNFLPAKNVGVRVLVAAGTNFNNQINALLLEDVLQQATHFVIDRAGDTFLSPGNIGIQIGKPPAVSGAGGSKANGESWLVFFVVIAALIGLVAVSSRKSKPSGNEDNETTERSPIDDLADFRAEAINKILNAHPNQPRNKTTDAQVDVWVSIWERNWRDWEERVKDLLKTRFTYAEQMSFENLGAIPQVSFQGIAVNGIHQRNLMIVNKQIMVLDNILQDNKGK